MFARVKKVEELVPGDVLNVNGIGVPVRVVDRHRIGHRYTGLIRVKLKNGFMTTYHEPETLVEYVTAEEWED